MKRILFFALGYVAGFATLFVLMLIFGDYSDTPTQVSAAPVAVVAAAAPQPTGPSYQDVCDADESNMTEPQIAAFGQQHVNQAFHDWRGWVYDVDSRADGTYNLQIAMEERGLFWSRSIIIENIPSDMALRLNVEQPIAFSGRIAKLDNTFNVVCNPLYVDNYSIAEHP